MPKPRPACLYGALLGAAGLLLCWGFAVDDALISARMAANLASGLGYRFNPHGDIVDAVTPLGYAHLLSSGGRESPLAVLQFARGIGAVAYVLGWARLGQLALPRQGGWLLALLLAFAPCAATWASTGMETPLVFGLLIVGLGGGDAPESRRVALSASLALGVAGAWRPELLACVGVLLLERASREQGLRRALPLLLGIAPTLLVIALRSAYFGRPMPLSVLAKPSDLEHGLRYALGGWILTGLPLCVVAPRVWPKLSPRLRWWTAALFAHAVALTLAGGDWMALFRLYVPVLPLALVVAVGIWRHAARWASLLRCLLAWLALSALWWQGGFAARHVMADRLALMDAARPLLEGHRVASVDIGWVSAVGPEAVIDLAGVSDPSIAVLPGGHTSKRIDAQLFERRRVDRLVVLCTGGPPPQQTSEIRPARQIEARMLNQTKDLKQTLEAVL
ncbi:MAG: hypothetical protein H6718_34540, partial [Polyangiaceae bacterium]|nr:hypothetical protein [Polyangiaceae bacterium]